MKASETVNTPKAKTRGVSSGRWIPVGLRRENRRLPCAICGLDGDTHPDHIIPYSRGGKSVRENIQPLCFVCNKIKGFKKTNDEVKQWIKANHSAFLYKQDRRARWLIGDVGYAY